MVAKTDIADLKITLDLVNPPVTRQIVVPLNLTLDSLHLVMQVAMGWTNSHLWEFRIGAGENESRWGLTDPDWPDGPSDGSKATLFSVLDSTGANSLVYTYDFGDDWEHIIEIDRVYAGSPEERARCPMLKAASGRCPPEDIGGPWGYAEYLEALDDPEHELHEELTEHYGKNFDPNAVPTKAIKLDLAMLAKRWAPRTRKKAPTKKKPAKRT